MCGIAGMWSDTRGSLGEKHIDALITMTHHIVNRGMDSSGWMGRDVNGELYIKRTIEDGHKLFDIHPVPNVPMKWIFTHTRGASCGSVREENAHPFDVGRIVGMQNGFCFKHVLLAKEHGVKCHPVDSHTLFELIQSRGEPMAYPEDWLGAIVWYDKVSQTIELRDNSFGAMFGGELDGCIAFASTDYIVKAVGGASIEEVNNLTLRG